MSTLPKYFAQGLLDVLIQTLHKSTEGSGTRPDEERVVSQRSPSQSGAESQKRAVRRAFLQLTTELTQRLFGLSQGSDLTTNDLVWALCPEPEEHWDEGRVAQLPKATDTFAQSTGMSTANSTMGASDFAQMLTGASENASEAGDPVGSTPLGMRRSASGVSASATLDDQTAASIMISWRDGVSPCRVAARNIWKMTGDEETMAATAQLFLEVCKGPSCDMSAVEKLLTQGADLMASNGEGSTILLGAVKSGCSVEVVTHLLSCGACPDVSGKEGVTPLMQVENMLQKEGMSKPLCAIKEALLRYGASEVQEPAQVLERLRETYGLKMVGALLTLQSPAALPWEVLEVIFLLFRELPLRIIKQALEPVAFRGLMALFQHFVGGADNLSSAYLGCRIMRAVYQQGDPTLQYLVRSHGAARWARRLAATKDVAQCGLYRQPHHERVTQEELSQEALALVEVLDKQSTGEEDPQDWQSNAKLVEIVKALDEKSASEGSGTDREAAAKEALMNFRELLKKAEKCALNEERCTAYELERSAIPGLLRHFLKHHATPSSLDPMRQPTMNHDRWTYFKEIFSEQTKQTRKGLVRLVKALHAVIDTGEALPVWRHKKERGLKALTEPVPLRLRLLKTGSAMNPFIPEGMRPQAAVMVEPLAQLSELTKYLIRVTPIVDPQYLTECFQLVGGTVRETGSGDLLTILAFEVLHADLPLPIHTVRRENTGETLRVLLSITEHQLVSKPNTSTPFVALHVALGRLHAVGGSQAYGSLLDDLVASLQGQPLPSGEEGQSRPESVQQVWQETLSLSSQNAAQAVAVITSERARISELSAGNSNGEGGEGGASDGVDPTMRVHTVMIAVSDEVPFELFWPMVRDDILAAVRELHPRGVTSSLEENVQAGVAQNGMGPIAQKLSLEEAETLAARVGHVVQTAVVVDQAAVQEAQRAAAKGNQNTEAIAVGRRIQFSPKSGKEWTPAIVVGCTSGGTSTAGSRSGANDKFDIIDDKGFLWEKLPRGRLRVPANRREMFGAGGAGVQAVLSQQDLVRIREHLRRRQEEWAERHTSNPGAGPGGAGRNDASANAGDASASVGPGSSARPTSAPATSQRPRASSSGLLDARAALLEAPAHGRRADSSGTTLSSREESIGEGDPHSALEMVHFIEEFDDDGDGRPGDDGDEDEEDYDENGPRDDGDEDDEELMAEDLPPLESSEAGDSTGDVIPGHRLGIRSREGDGDGGPGMDEELRVMEQLRAMEQIISEVLDPHDGPGSRSRRDPGGNAEDLLSGPMANLRIRMGGLGDGRIETLQIRRSGSAGGSRGSERERVLGVEPLRGDFPAFVRAGDLSNPTSSLDHPVAERLGYDDLVEDPNEDDPMDEDPADLHSLPRLCTRFCLYPAQEVEDSSLRPVALPPTWNLMKVMQFLHDQQFLRQQANGDSAKLAEADEAARAMGAPPCLVQAVQKVALEGWSLGYTLLPAGAHQAALSGDAEMANSPRNVGMEVDSSGNKASSPRRQMEESPAPTPNRTRGGLGLPARKRRRMLRNAATDQVAREMYSRFAEDESKNLCGPHDVIAQCGESRAVTDAIDLLHLLKAQGPSLGIEASLWVSSKLDRKLRYQLEDPLSVVSGTLPLWATTLPRLCPFLFSLKTRKMLLKYTAFGPSFGVHWTQENKVGSFLRRRATVQTELNAQSDPRKIQELSQELSNIEEHVVKSNFWLGTLQTTLVKMQKGEGLLRQSEIAMDLVATGGHLVEVQFDGENGFGSAVTQSFYVEVARDLTERETNKRVPLWLPDDQSGAGYLTNRRGLTIQPLAEGGPIRDEVVRRFRFLGRLMGQALREGFIVPLPLAEDFFALVLGESLGPTSFPRPGCGSTGELCGVLADFVAELNANQAQLPGKPSQDEIRAWKLEQAARSDFSERFLMHDGVDNQAFKGMSFNQYVQACCACFVATGLSGDPLVPNGENTPITIDNVADFVDQAAQFWFHKGVIAQVESFRAGLNDVFPFECLVAFSRSELRELFCGEDRIDWDEQALLQHLHPVGGLTDKSAVYKYLVADLIEMSQADRSRFVDFVSSCPRLPPGGMAKFHVDVFPDTTSKQGFPRSRACANQLYLPQYSSKEELHEKLHEAMHSSFGHHEQRARD